MYYKHKETCKENNQKQSRTDCGVYTNKKLLSHCIR
jgi:hypothetical protein